MMLDHFYDGAKRRYCLVMPLCEGGSLRHRLANKAAHPIRFDDVERWAKQLLGALVWLHEVAQVVHADLDLGNIFLDGESDAVVGDFGVALMDFARDRLRVVEENSVAFDKPICPPEVRSVLARLEVRRYHCSLRKELNWMG